MSTFRPFLFISVLSLMALTSCATLIEGSSQEVTFEAKGATDVVCNLTTKGEELAYKVYPPQRIWMKRSRVNMMADCYAPGNRHKIFEISTGLEPWAATNVANGVVPGVTYDAYDRALFKYPSLIVIDMSDTVATPNLLPEYDNGDGINPKDAGIEYMGPKLNALPEDAANKARRDAAYEQYDIDQAYEAERNARIQAADPGVKK